jgi:hypothetical protein
MTRFTDLIDCRALRRVGMSCESKKTAFAFVSVKACLKPSSPRVAYAVTIGIDWDAEASCQLPLSRQYLGPLTANTHYELA